MTDLPNGWQYKTLGEVAKWGSGGTPRAGTKSFYGGDIPWAIIGDLNDSYVTQTARTITQKGLDESSAKMVPVGAVLIAMYGSIGKLGMNTIPMATNQAIAFAIPKTELVLQKYLFHYLSSQREIFLWSGKGATQQNISQTLLKAWKIPLPSLPEQRKIVELLEDHLSRLDAALADVKQAKLKAAQFRKSLLQSIFEGKYSPNFSNWEHKAIGDFAEVKGGKRLPKGTKWSDEPTRHPYIRATDIKSGKIKIEDLVHVPDSVWKSISRYVVRENDVVITIAGTIGEIAVVPSSLAGANLTENAAKIVFDHEYVLPSFMSMYLQSPSVQQEFKELSKATTQAKLALYRIATVEIPIPTLNEQEEIIELVEEQLTYLSSSLNLISDVELHVASLRRSLLQAAFTGELTKEVASV